MKTIASKYKKLNKPVYAIFVDFKKAFDSVCRQALFLKLAKCKVIGRFFNVLKNMYSNSYAFIKLSGHVSKKIHIKKGTEQGHPLSPDLFKLFLNDLSPQLDYTNCPYLSGMRISHLLWADDLILLSMDKYTAQKQLNTLAKFCSTWGIEINELKTQVVVFQKESPLNIDAKFTLNDKPIEVVESYCYLGIILHHSGSFTMAQASLKTKAMRALFGLKRVLIRSKVSFKALTTLFDSLIKPIALYGAPIWAPHSTIWNSIVKSFEGENNECNGLLKKISGSLQEKLQLSFLKWALGLHRKASNIGVWGESGRLPLIFQSIRLSLNYFKRLENLEPNSFVSAALREQKQLNLPWYARLKSLLKLDEIYSLNHVTAFQVMNPKSKIIDHNKNSTANNCKKIEPKIIDLPLSDKKIMKPVKSKKFRTWRIVELLNEKFKKCWDHQKSTSPKLTFYNSIKSSFGREPYLDYCKGFSRRYCTTQLRISAHDLQIERGRYINLPREKRICKWCKTTLGEDYIEDEPHVLFECDLYSSLRSKLITNLNKTPPLECHDSTQIEPRLNISQRNFKPNLMSILSPYSKSYTLTSPIHPCQVPDIQQNSPAFTSLIERRAYAINCICTYLLKCSEERKKLTESSQKARLHENRIKQIIVNLI